MPSVRFFVTPVYPYGNDHYFHEIVALAEGFSELGYKISGNCNYWMIPETGRYLIPEEPESDFDLAIYDYRYVTSFAHLLFRDSFPNFRKDRPHVLVDRNDWISPIWTNRPYNRFELIVSGNLYRKVQYAKNMRPWAIGLTSRVMKSVDRFFDESVPMEPVVAHNFRVANNVRDRFQRALSGANLKYPLRESFSSGRDGTQAAVRGDDPDSVYWKQTTRRHDPEYFKSLNRNLLFSALCAYFEYRPICYQPYQFADKLRRRPFIWGSKLSRALGLSDSWAWFMFQHDSFRFYEVLYSRSCPIQIDLKNWGFWMPEMPLPDIHYLAIPGFDTQSFVEKLNSMEPSRIQDIGRVGREFVKEHYSPSAQAKRLLAYLKETTNSRYA